MTHDEDVPYAALLSLLREHQRTRGLPHDGDLREIGVAEAQTLFPALGAPREPRCTFAVLRASMDVRSPSSCGMLRLVVASPHARRQPND